MPHLESETSSNYWGAAAAQPEVRHTFRGARLACFFVPRGFAMSFDPQAATAAYIDALGADALAKAAAYTAGNHWLLLWGLVVSAAFTWVIVRWGVLDRLASRLGRRGCPRSRTRSRSART